MLKSKTSLLKFAKRVAILTACVSLTGYAQGSPVAIDTSQVLQLPGGVLYGTFRAEDGPFYIQGSVTVPAGQVLNFEAGSKIYIGGKYSTITVFGQLLAKGTAENPVTFLSGKAEPNPWDWDRIYIRTRNRCVFEHVVLQHANYGIMVENGSAIIKNSVFKKNSLHGLVARNATVSLSNTKFSGGHVCAILVDKAAQVTADSIQVTDNITALAVRDGGSFSATRSSIVHNSSGIVIEENSSINLVATNVTKNRKGVIAATTIPKKMLEMVYGNGEELSLASTDEIDKLLKTPEDVKSVMLPVNTVPLSAPKSFTSGFSALQAAKQASVSFIGNVTGGFRYIAAESVPSNDTLIFQTRYPEDSTDQLAGLQPEVQLFLSGRRGDADINFLADLYGNQWTGVRKNVFNLNMTYENQQLLVGDFFENGSEISISGRQMTGVKYKSEFAGMGRGMNRFDFTAAIGETETPKDSGDNELDLYNDVVDSGLSVRQQLTYLLSLQIRPGYNSRIRVNSFISKDQTSNPFLRSEPTDPGVPDPLQAQNGTIAAEYDILNGAITLMGEVGVGEHDTLSPDKEIDWWNPAIANAISKVFGEIENQKHWALLLGADGKLAGYGLSIGYSQIAPSYFSAGNPYLETDKRIVHFSAERQIRENISATAQYEFEQSELSTTFDLSALTPGPQLDHQFDAGVKYSPSEKLPDFGFDFTVQYQGRDEVEVYEQQVSSLLDTVKQQSAEVRSRIGIDIRQRFKQGFDYAVSYRFLYTNDVTEYVDTAEVDLDDGFQNQFSARWGIKYKRVLSNRTSLRVTTKSEVRDSLRGLQFKISNDLKWNVIPRTLSFVIKGDYKQRIDDEYDDELAAREKTVTEYYSAGFETKYSLTSRTALKGVLEYESSRDETLYSSENFDAFIGGLYLTYLF